MRRTLDGKWGWIRDEVREILAGPDFVPPHDLDIEQYRAQVLEWIRALTTLEAGTGLGFPEAYGGKNDVGGAVTAFETLAFGDLSLVVKVGVQFGLFGGAVLHLGTEHHHERYLKQVISVELPGCFCMSETGHGSNVQDLRTTATYDAETGEFVIDTPDAHARKDYIGNAGRDGRMAAVFAQLHSGGESHGVHCLLVPIRDADGTPCPGVELEDCGVKLGLNGVDNGHVAFHEVRVPREALLDRFASVAEDGTYSSAIDDENKRFFTMLGTLIQGRISVSGAGLSAAKSALVNAVRYGDRRRQFGPPDGGEEAPLLDYLGHQRRLLPALATTYALHFAQTELVRELDQAFGGDGDEQARRELETKAAGVKALATWHATSTIQTCREACGGQGYMATNRFAALKADTDVFTTFEGDNTILLQLVAKSLLTGYQEEFGEMGPIGLTRFGAEFAVDTVVERVAARKVFETLVGAVTSDDFDDAGVLDTNYHLEMFRWREEHVLSTIARRLKGGIDAGHDPFDVFARTQDHVLLAARSHLDRVVLEAFLEAVERCEDESIRGMLGTLADLHALATIERDRGWYMEHGRLSAQRSKTIINAVNELCATVREHAVPLVDAFGVPEQWLAPIARGEEPGLGH
ncbi:MAG: acyl-CoA dehydrogenase [Solirubrobacterales bacterium]